MGAQSFTDISHGATATEAFVRATEDAAWEYGHGGYTGTIAEKSDFLLFSLPRGLSAADFEEAVMGELFHPAYDDWKGTRVDPAERVTSRKREHVEWRKTPWGQRQVKNYKRVAKVPGAVDVVRKAIEVADDKWGPAVCVEETNAERIRIYRQLKGLARVRGLKFYRFFGMASS